MSPRERAMTWVRARIAALPPPQGASDWPRQLEISGGVLLVGGDNVCCWFLDPEGALFEADRDSVVPRLERVADPERRRSVLQEAVKAIPELLPLLDSPAAPEGHLEVHSADGRWRARVHDDFDTEGGEATTLELFDAHSGERTSLLQLRDPSLRLVRFLEARRLLLVDPDGLVEVDLDAPRPRRRLPSTPTSPPTSPTPSPAPTPRYVGELTAESSLVSVFVFLWIAGLTPLLPAVMLLVAPDWAARLQAFGWLAGSVAIAVVFVRIAARPRVVEIAADGTLRVSWGRRLPLTMRRVELGAIEDAVIAREARFAVQSRGSRAPSMHARPDRWRIKARFAKGRTVDVGTTATEQEAAVVRARLLAWRASAVEQPPRGSRA